jgi:hypothetical protein
MAELGFTLPPWHREGVTISTTAALLLKQESYQLLDNFILDAAISMGDSSVQQNCSRNLRTDFLLG